MGLPLDLLFFCWQESSECTVVDEMLVLGSQGDCKHADKICSTSWSPSFFICPINLVSKRQILSGCLQEGHRKEGHLQDPAGIKG